MERGRADLVARHQAYRDVLDSAPCACIITDLAGAVLDANNAAVRLLGYRDPSMLRRKPLAVFVPLSERPAFRRAVLRAPHVNGPLEWTGTVAPRDADPFVGQLTASPVPDRSGAVLELCWIVRRLSGAPYAADTEDEAQAMEGAWHAPTPCDRVIQRRAEARAVTDEQVAQKQASDIALADELYNRLGQDLVALQLSGGRLDTVASDANSPGPALQDEADELKRLAGAVLADLLDLAATLHSMSLDRFGLVPALGMLAEVLGRSTGARLDIQVVGLQGQRLSPGLERLVFWLVQEALSVLSPAAPAVPISVTLSSSDEWLRVLVEARADPSRSHQLEQQAGWQAVKGWVEIRGGMTGSESTPDGDTTLWAAIPTPNTHASAMTE